MKLKFVNHASIIFSYDKINLITDPWIEGEVFHNGWSLLSKTKFKYSDFDKITHIWFSHEHPDHFFPPNIKSIPSEIRSNITILYMKTNDKKVVNFCKNLGFKDVLELNPNEDYNLTDKFTITNGTLGHDSWLYIKTDLYSFLNTNDCLINTIDKAKTIHDITSNIDVLLTQFSYAAKHGNINQPEKRIQASQDKYDQIKIHFDVFKPKYFVPIASYVWFSHEENFYMNDNMNLINDVAEFSLLNKVEPIVLHPSAEYQIGSKHNNVLNVNKYLSDYQCITIENTRKTNSCDFFDIEKSANKLISQIYREDKLSAILLSFYPIKFYITDLKLSVKFSTISGFKKTKEIKENTNIHLTSEVLNFCFKFNFGFGATDVNARFQTNKDEDMILWNYYVSVTDSLNHKDSTLKRVFGKIKRKLTTVK
jgi:UDP-MurNAc hydroxylase